MQSVFQWATQFGQMVPIVLVALVTAAAFASRAVSQRQGPSRRDRRRERRDAARAEADAIRTGQATTPVSGPPGPIDFPR